MTASLHLQKQISSSPVWLRDNEPPANINFLSKTEKCGTPGRIVVTRCQHDLARDIDELERLDALTLEATDDSSSIGKNQSESQICSSDEDEEHKNCGLPDWHADLIKENSNQSVTDNRQPNSEPHTVQPSASQTARSDVHSTRSVMEILSKKRRGQMRTCLIDVSQAPPPADEVPLTSKVKTQTSSSHPIVSNVKPERRSIVSPGTASASSQNAQNLDNIKYVLFDWRTKETVQMLTSIEALCQDVRLCDEPSPVESLPDKVPTSDMKRSNNVQPTNGVPDDEELSAEKQQYEIKVKEFYGQKCLDSSAGNDREVILPPVHSCSQLTLRRKIVLDKLSGTLSEIIGRTTLTMASISTPVRELVHTFNLTSHNILLKHNDWMAVGYVILKLLATRDGHLCEQISIEAVTEFIRPALSAVRLSVADIDEIVRHMTQLSNDDDDGCDFEPRHVSSARSDEENRGNELHSKSVDENLPTSEDNHDELD